MLRRLMLLRAPVAVAVATASLILCALIACRPAQAAAWRPPALTLAHAAPAPASFAAPASATASDAHATADPLRRLRAHMRRGFGSQMDQADIPSFEQMGAHLHAPQEFSTTTAVAEGGLELGSPGPGVGSVAPLQHPLLPTPDAQRKLSLQYAEFRELLLWLLARLGATPGIGGDGVELFPRPTDAEAFGFLHAFNLHAPEGHTLRAEFQDVATLQTMEYATFGKFFLWLEVPNVLYSVRDDSFQPLSSFLIHRMSQRFATTYREDVNFLNFAPAGSGAGLPQGRRSDSGEGLGEMYRFVLLKWKLEHINDILSAAEAVELVDTLLQLRERIQSPSSGLSATFRATLVPGVMLYWYSTFLEEMAHFKLSMLFHTAERSFEADCLRDWESVLDEIPPSIAENFRTNLTVEALLAPVHDLPVVSGSTLPPASVSELLTFRFRESISLAARRKAVFNATSAALDAVREEAKELLIENVIQQALMHDRRAQQPQSQAHTQAQQQQKQGRPWHTASAEELNKDDDEHNRWAQSVAESLLSALPLPNTCTSNQASRSEPVEAVCATIRSMRLPETHEPFVVELATFVEQQVLASEASSNNDASSLLVLGPGSGVNNRTIADGHHRRSDAFAEVFEQVLLMQTTLLEEGMIHDASAHAGVMHSSAALATEAARVAHTTLARLYSTAVRAAEMRLSDADVSLWARWVRTLARSMLSPSSSSGSASPFPSLSFSDATWDSVSCLAFDRTNVWGSAPLSAWARATQERLRSLPFAATMNSHSGSKSRFQTQNYDVSIAISLDPSESGSSSPAVIGSAAGSLSEVFHTPALRSLLNRIRLQSILDAAGVSNVDFRSEVFLHWVIESAQVHRSLSALALLVERLVQRESDNARAFALDEPKSWHSDRTKSPSAAYDFTLSTSSLDLLVYLDSLCFAPEGHVFLQQIARYHQAELLLITRKVNAGDKDLLENTYRLLVPLNVWLAGTNDFERWRWSWPQSGSGRIMQGSGTVSARKYPEAIELIQSPEAKVVAKRARDAGLTDNVSLALLLAAIGTVCFACIEVIRLLVTKPWTRPSLALNGSIPHEAEYHLEYERREWGILWKRHVPLQILLHFLAQTLLATFALTLNYSFFSPTALLMYIVIFSYLTTVILDVYLVKTLLYAASLWILPRADFALQPPLCPCEITKENSMLVLNPLRPANDDQLRAVVSKNVDLLSGVPNKHVVSVLILQCVGNSLETSRRYERIVRDTCFDNPRVAQHVKDRFFVFQMGGISKPHNMFVVMRWMFQAREETDPVTSGFLYGIQTHVPLADLTARKARVPAGEELPVFMQWAEHNTRVQIAVAREGSITAGTSDEGSRSDRDRDRDRAEAYMVRDAPGAAAEPLSVVAEGSDRSTEGSRSPLESTASLSSSSPPRRRSRSLQQQPGGAPGSPEGTESLLEQAAVESELLHVDAEEMRRYGECTFETLVYLGGNTAYKGQPGQGADAGILCTEGGLAVLAYLRNENNPGAPLLENFVVLDADNFIEPVTLLRMAATMNDSYLVWQPSINFYNATQSMYSYVKGYANTHLGNIMCVSNTLTLGGVRSFGKYFGRLKRYFYEECTSASRRSAPAHYAFLYALCSHLATLTVLAFLVRPLFAEYTWILLWSTLASLGLTVALSLWSAHGGQGCCKRRHDAASSVDESEAESNCDEKLITSRYQNMLPLNRMFIQSEDARHGGPFGRACFIMDDVIHEATPPCPIDDSKRENTKWMPTFDMRDWLLLHTPILWCILHLKVSIVLSALFAIACFAGTIVAWNGVADGFMQFVLLAGCISSAAICAALCSMYAVATPESLALVRQTRLPDMPARAEYAEALVSRGVFGECIWAAQFLLGLTALLFPGTIEVAFPFLGESHLLLIIILLVHPKFSGAFLTRVHRIARPRYVGQWVDSDAPIEPQQSSQNDAAVQARHDAAARSARAVDVLSPTSTDGLVSSESPLATPSPESSSPAVAAAWGEKFAAWGEKDSSSSVIAKTPSTETYTHSTLFVNHSGHHLCGRELAAMERRAAAQSSRYFALKRWWRNLTSGSDEGQARGGDLHAVMPADLASGHDNKNHWLPHGENPDILLRNSSNSSSGSPHLGALFRSADEVVASGELDDDANQALELAPLPSSQKFKRGEDGFMTAEESIGVMPTSPKSDARSSCLSQSQQSTSLHTQSVHVLTLALEDTPADARICNLSATAEAVLQAQHDSHESQLHQQTRAASRRKYLVTRERRRDLVWQLLFLWILHDIPVGCFEFAASTSVFLVKIVNKPGHVVWACLGVFLELRGLLAAKPISGTWPSFVESEETLPLSEYVREYNMPMACGVGVLLLCLPGLTANIMQIPGFSQHLFSRVGILCIGIAFAILLGVYPAWRQWEILRFTLLQPAKPAVVLVASEVAGQEEMMVEKKLPWHTQYEWNRLKQFSTMKMLLSLLTDCGIGIGLLVVGVLAYPLNGLIPSVFFIRSFPILVSSFIFGPGVGFLLGKVNGTGVDTSTNPPTILQAHWTKRMVLLLGWIVLLLSVYFVYFFTKMLLPVQALGMHGPTAPTGDGSMSMMLPFTLSYNEMLKAPWYFVVPYATIVYGGTMLGIVSWSFGAVHQVWTAWRDHQEAKLFQAHLALATAEAMRGGEEVGAEVVSPKRRSVRRISEDLSTAEADALQDEVDALSTVAKAVDQQEDEEKEDMSPRSHLAEAPVIMASLPLSKPRSLQPMSVVRSLHPTPVPPRFTTPKSSARRMAVTPLVGARSLAQSNASSPGLANRRASYPPGEVPDGALLAASPKAGTPVAPATGDLPALRRLATLERHTSLHGSPAPGSYQSSPVMDSRTLMSPALVSRLMETPYQSVEHMRIREEQAAREREEEEEASFSPHVAVRRIPMQPKPSSRVPHASLAPPSEQLPMSLRQLYRRATAQLPSMSTHGYTPVQRNRDLRMPSAMLAPPSASDDEEKESAAAPAPMPVAMPVAAPVAPIAIIRHGRLVPLGMSSRAVPPLPMVSLPEMLPVTPTRGTSAPPSPREADQPVGPLPVLPATVRPPLRLTPLALPPPPPPVAE